MLLSEGAVDEQEAPCGRGIGWGLGAEPLEISINMPLDCKQISFSCIKMYLILDRIGHLLYDVIQ